MSPRRTNPVFMNGVPEVLALRLLADREMYGYELVRAIEAATGRAIRLGEGVVYPALHSLEQQGFLRSRPKPVNGRTRIYYAITRAGQKRLEALTKDWTRIAGAVSQVLHGGERGVTTA